MKFRKNTSIEPDINLIPFIDVLLVVLIFLMLTTTWSKFNEMNVSLPSASAQATTEPSTAWVVSVSSQGNYAVNGVKLEGRSLQDLSNALSDLRKLEASLLIKADASASHQSVVNVLEAARLNGVSKIAFATQNPLPSGKP
ncbi:MAG: biopolymer transporter ExbD [Burkholderiales bacterium]|nr:biopolymer transporter ExbD [Burkholderiales bacterium]